MYESRLDVRTKVEKYVPKNVPVYDPILHEFETPEQFKTILDDFLFTREFIDWVAENGYYIVNSYPREKPRALASVYLDTRRIVIRTRKKEIRKLALVHELIHVAVPDNRLAWGYILSIEFNKTLGAYEDVIEQAAVRFSQDEELVAYAQEKIPVKKLKRN